MRTKGRRKERREGRNACDGKKKSVCKEVPGKEKDVSNCTVEMKESRKVWRVTMSHTALS